jgi:hypothetical protein
MTSTTTGSLSTISTMRSSTSTGNSSMTSNMAVNPSGTTMENPSRTNSPTYTRALTW